ncbi:MAG: FGGY family carbohydrate kinase, partial [Bacteroidota bacterium]
MYSIGYDIGSSSVKVALVNISTGAVMARLQEPTTEMNINAPKAGWAEQDPETWWQHICTATQRIIKETGIESSSIQSVGISYQMHGLVLVEGDFKVAESSENSQATGEVTRPSIIWCDSRAVELGAASFQRIGAINCLSHCLNSPGNFTATKLKWVAENEPAIYARSNFAMLPGDFIALRLSGTVNTTIGGLSEGVLWDFKQNDIAHLVIDDLGLDADKIPPLVPNVGIQSIVNEAGATATGLPIGIPIAYRAGDQPNNALSLNVLEPGEVAATAGTSGVVYGVTDQLVADAKQRVNSFAHVNHTAPQPRIGGLVCSKGAGGLHRWLRQHLVGEGLSDG